MSTNSPFAAASTGTSFATPVPDDAALRQQLLSIVETFTCMSQYAEMKAFFSNAANIKGITDAVSIYGTPPKNRESYHTGAGMFGKWHDFCDWDMGILKFYLAARFFLNYPNIAKDQANCQKIADYISTLPDELKSADNKYVNDNDANYHNTMTTVINDRLSYYNSLSSSLSCNTYLADKLQEKQQAIAKTTLDQSLQSNEAALKAATAIQGTGSSVGMYFLYGVGGLIAVLILVKMFKKD